MKKKILLIAAFKKEIEGLFKKYSFTKVEKKETFPYGSLYQSKLYDLWICGLAVHSIKQKKIYLLSSEARNEIKKKIHLSYPVIINIGVAGAIDKSLKKKKWVTVYLVTGDHPNKLYSDNSHFFLRLLNISSNKTVTNCITISHPWSGELDKNLLENISNLKKKANFPCLVDMELFFLRPLFSEQSFFYSFKYIIDYGSKELNHLNKNYFKTTIDEMQKEVLKIIEAIRSTHEEQL